MRLRVTLFTLLILLLVAGPVMAQGGEQPACDPAETAAGQDQCFPDVNLCYEGAAWGDGRCNAADPALRDWYWTCGWYRAQAELADIPLPEQCQSAPPPPAPGCYELGEDYLDQYFPGTLNLPGSVKVYGYGTNDGTCTGQPTYSAMWVQTSLTDPRDVAALCDSIAPGYLNTLHLVSAGASVPFNVWACGPVG